MRRKALCLAIALVLTALVLLLAAWPTSGQTDEGRPYETENVFVVSIDGIRNTEAFDASYPALFVPHMWNELRPQGAIYRNFYNRAQTYTTPGNNTLINGAWEWMPNIGQRLDLRAKAPTIFEYYRREHPEVPRDKLWAVVGKANVRLAEHSIHPFYGADYGAILSFPAGHDDQAGWAEMQRVMDTYHPSLVFFHLGEVDHAGHTGNWITYTLAIRNADAIVKALWDKIQSDPVYRDRTTMIVSTDHGRHDDEHGGFKGHGGICEGDKRLIFLALGPDIRPGVEITTPREQTDIAPTVGALMGFDTPLAEGHVLTEMLIEGSEGEEGNEGALSPSSFQLTSSPGRAVQPAIAVDGRGIHVVWTDDRSGAREIYYKMSRDGGRSWSDDLQLSHSGVEARAPAIAADEDGIHVVWQDYRDGNWGLYYRKYTEPQGWSAEERLALSVVEDLAKKQLAMLWAPALTPWDGGLTVASPTYPLWIGTLSTSDGGNTWITSTVTTKSSNAQAVDLAARGREVHAVWYQIEDENWEVFYNHSPDGGVTWAGKERLTMDDPTAPHNSYDPAVLATGDEVHVVWTDDRNGAFQIFYRRRENDGWTVPEPLTSYIPHGGAWHPDLIATSEGLRLVWEDYRDGNAEIYTRLSTDGGRTWGPETRLTRDGAFSIHPRAASQDDVTYYVWQDNRDGGWEIYFARDRFKAYLPLITKDYVLGTVTHPKLWRLETIF